MKNVTAILHGMTGKTVSAEADAERSTEGEALCARVQGVQLPCAGQGRQPLPSRVDACVGSYWVLPDAEIGRTGSKAAFLPSSALGENEGKCSVPCGQRGQAFPVGGTLERKEEDCD